MKFYSIVESVESERKFDAIDVLACFDVQRHRLASRACHGCARMFHFTLISTLPLKQNRGSSTLEVSGGVALQVPS